MKETKGFLLSARREVGGTVVAALWIQGDVNPGRLAAETLALLRYHLLSRWAIPEVIR